jgi:hypothetical protein
MTINRNKLISLKQIEGGLELQQKINTIKDGLFYEPETPLSEWTIIHNLNRFPKIVITDEYNMQIIGEIEYITLNSVIIRFSEPFKGKAHLS